MTTFVADISRFVEKTELSIDTVVRKLSFDAMEGLLKRSPVDEGTFRGNWRIGINGPVLEPNDRTLPAGFSPADLALLQTVKGGDVVSFTNNLPYAGPLEDGWSMQAPNGVLALTFQQLRQDFRRAVEAVT